MIVTLIVCFIWVGFSNAQEASGAVARFLGGENHNLKYLGIHLLALLVRLLSCHIVF